MFRMYPCPRDGGDLTWVSLVVSACPRDRSGPINLANPDQGIGVITSTATCRFSSRCGRSGSARTRVSRPKGNRDEPFRVIGYITLYLFFSSPPPSVAYEPPRPWSPVGLSGSCLKSSAVGSSPRCPPLTAQRVTSTCVRAESARSVEFNARTSPGAEVRGAENCRKSSSPNTGHVDKLPLMQARPSPPVVVIGVNEGA